MITKAYIYGLPEEGDNHYTVRVVLFEDNTHKQAVMLALCCNQPGQYDGYKINDVVYVTFEGETLNNPVIIGKLYDGELTDVPSYHIVDNLKITGSVTLPDTATIGGYGAEDFYKLYNLADKWGEGRITATDYPET